MSLWDEAVACARARLHPLARRLPCGAMRPWIALPIVLVACRGKGEPEKATRMLAATVTPVVAAASSAPVASAAPAASLPPPSLPPLSSGVVLTLDITEGRSPTLSGETNLPDETTLVVDLLEGPCSLSLTPGGTFSSYVTVRGGRWSTRFGTGKGADQPVRDGTFEVTVSTPSPKLQPASVQAVLGKDGKGLKGKLIIPNKFAEPTVVVTRKLTFGDPNEAPRLTREHCEAEMEKLKKLAGGQPRSQ